MDVDVDHAHRGGLVLVDEAAQRHDAGVVDQHVEWPEALLGGIDEGLEGVALGHVELEPGGVGADLGGRLLGELGVEVSDGDLHPLARKGLRRRLADAARGAGDGGDLADEDAGLLCHEEPCLLRKVNDASPNASASAPGRAGCNLPHGYGMSSGPLSVNAARNSRMAPSACVLSVGQVIDFVHAVAANCAGMFVSFSNIRTW